MIRQLGLRQTTSLRTMVVPQVRMISTTPVRGSVIDTAKNVLHKANKKIGEVAAEGIDKTQHAAPHAQDVGEAADKVNKKTGEVLADGINKAQKAAPDVDSVGDAAQKVNKKTGEVLADGIGKAQKVVPENQRSRVHKNYEGYQNLQDKGSKAETEQKRPDDGF